MDPGYTQVSISLTRFPAVWCQPFSSPKAKQQPWPEAAWLEKHPPNGVE
jgi:hypothetical protein